MNDLEQAKTDRQIDMLLNPRIAAGDIQLPGWLICSRLIGDDAAARRRFASLYRRFPSQLGVLESVASIERVRSMIGQFDPYRIPSKDLDQWMLLLALETLYAEELTTQLSSRSCMSLSSTHLGPKPTSRADQEVLSRLIDQWVVSHRRSCPTREQLLIAMRYGCEDRVRQICQSVFDDHDAAPSTLVMTMLCASSIGMTDCEGFMQTRLHDRRTAHVWQLIASRKTKIRTQVRDVALALLLHHHGIDPRKVGFQELQADPMLVFRDHSLGFADDQSRERTHRRSLDLLYASED